MERRKKMKVKYNHVTMPKAVEACLLAYEQLQREGGWLSKAEFSASVGGSVECHPDCKVCRTVVKIAAGQFVPPKFSVEREEFYKGAEILWDEYEED